MTPEMIAIVAVGVALAGMILNSNRELRGELRRLGDRIDALEARVATLEQRMAHLEGLFEGVTRWKADPTKVESE